MNTRASDYAKNSVRSRGERERLLGSREGKLKITFPFYGKGTGIRKLLREGKGNLRL